MEANSTVPRAAIGLAGTAVALLGILQRHKPFGTPLIGAGAALAVASLMPPKVITSVLPREVEAEHVVSILRPASELFAFWRSVENCPQWMKLVRRVQETGPRTSHWEVEGPAGIAFSYDAEIVTEVAGEKIIWQSTADSPIAIHGVASFKSIGERGTEVRVRIRYRVPVGLAGAFAALMGSEPTSMLKEDLRRFKQLTEAGEIADNTSPRGAKKNASEPGALIKKTIDAAATLKNTHGAAVEPGSVR